MDSKTVHVCPFCQSPNPVADARCSKCHRSLAGLPLYGSAIDDALSGREPQPLVDLPLREDVGAATAPSWAPDTEAAVLPPLRPPLIQRRRMGRGTKVSLASAIMAVGLVGGWLVRARDRDDAPRAEGSVAPSVGPSPALVAPLAAAPVTTAPARAASVAVPQRRSPAVPAPPATRVASRPARREGAAPVSRVVAPAAPARGESRRPAAEPIEDEGPEPPDFDPDSTELVRARDDGPRTRAPQEPADAEGTRAGARSVAERLQRAEHRRDVLAYRVSRLRARAHATVVTDVEEYQRVQRDLEAALEEQDRLDAQVTRLRRQVDRRQ